MKNINYKKNNFLLDGAKKFFLENYEERINFLKKKKFIFIEISKFINSCLSSPKKIILYCCGNSIIADNIKCEQIDIFEISEHYLNQINQIKINHSLVDNFNKIQDYDHIIISDIEYQKNPSYNLDKIASSMSDEARIFVISKSLVWFFLLKIYRVLLNKKYPKNNFLPMHYLTNLYDSCGFEIVRNEKIIFFPIYIPILTSFLNKIFRLPIFNFFCLNNITILKKKIIRNRDKNNISVIIPCKNEGKNIQAIASQLINLGKKTEYLFGDDKSTDNTKTEIFKIKNQNQNHNDNINIKYYEGPGICKSKNVYKGIEYASGEIIVIYDADITVTLSEISFCIEILNKNDSDIINCSRMIHPQDKNAMKKVNFIGNIIFAYLFSILFKIKITDTLCGTKIFYKKDWPKIKQDLSTWGAIDLWGDFDILIGAYKNNLKITEVPISYKERIAGETKMKSIFTNGLRMLWIILYSFYKIKIKS